MDGLVRCRNGNSQEWIYSQSSLVPSILPPFGTPQLTFILVYSFLSLSLLFFPFLLVCGRCLGLVWSGWPPPNLLLLSSDADYNSDRIHEREKMMRSVQQVRTKQGRGERGAPVAGGACVGWRMPVTWANSLTSLPPCAISSAYSLSPYAMRSAFVLSAALPLPLLSLS